MARDRSYATARAINRIRIVIIGSGKDGLPIILGNANTRAAAALPTEDGAGRKHDTPAVGPATPMEKLQASGAP